MELTLPVSTSNGASGPGRLQICADDRSLTPYAGLAITGELVRGLGLVGLVEGELSMVCGVAPVKQRARGLSAGELAVSIAECQLTGAECFDDLEDVRADRAGAPLRAIARTPSAPTARQLARRFERGHVEAIERAVARAAKRLDCELGRDLTEAVTIDLDATETEVYGRAKQGAARSHTGALAYSSYVATWAQRGRALTSELRGGNESRISAAESAAIVARATGLLSAEHGEVTVRGDSGFYAVALMIALRAQGARFTFSAPRTSTMWRAVGQIPDNAWADAVQMRGAQVAEQAFTPAGWEREPLRLIVRRVPVSAAEIRAGSPRARRRSTIPADQLQMVLDGRLASTFAYSFIVTDVPAAERTCTDVECFHRQRAQIEERFKDAKLGQALRHLPSGDMNANRLWLTCALMALNITALLCDVSPAAAASGNAPDDTPLRRHAKTLGHLMICVPARIVRTARQIIVRLPAGFRHADVFRDTYHAAYALPGP